VHAFDPPAVFFAGLATPFLRPATVLSSQRCFRSACSPAWKRLVHWSERLTDGVVVNCRALETYRRSAGWTAPEVHLCYNGLETRRFQRLSAPPRPQVIPDDAIVIGSVCGLRPEKGLSTLLLAFAATHAANPRTFLVIVGDGSERTKLEQQARQLGIAASCLIQPTASDVVPWLSLIDIFVLASPMNEALSNALMEAMACGCACVASNVGGNPELIEHERTGLLFEPGDVGVLARHLRLLTADADRRRQFVEQALVRVARDFSLDAAAQRMAAIYEQVLGRTPVASAAAPRMESLSHNGQAMV
jgi:glycosyltransferase involved in cell wall biosynthesis